jgi:peptidoglycan/xylan/chitin deacetylase (PgdA/CDA1 family)
MSPFKQALLNVLRLPGATAPFARFTRGRAAVFMLHRFREQDSDVDGHDPAELRRTLDYLRRRKYDVTGLNNLFQRLRGEGPPLNRTVAFTIDDGYRDHATVASHLFAEFDYPVTTFVVTGFLDGEIWFWWDQIEFVFSVSARQAVAVEFGELQLAYPLANEAQRSGATADFTDRCKQIPDDDRRAAIVALAAAAEVDLPSNPPARYQPMTWDQLHACEARGMSFGPHTVTHPILSRTSDEQSHKEIAQSWHRLRAEAADPVPVFAYPNGKWDDFGQREMSTLEELGFLGSLAAESGYADAARVQGEPPAAFRVPRFTYPNYLPQVIQAVSGLERVKEILRREQ